MRNQVLDSVVKETVFRFVESRNLPRWYAREIVLAEVRGLSDEEVASLYAPRVAAATLEYRKWEGAM
jgi:hypothetical protein